MDLVKVYGCRIVMKIVIDGNIGAGKTTQLGLLESKGWHVHREPIHKWPLKEFYENQGRWGFLLHMRILQTLCKIPTERHVIYERCIWSSRYVFWDMIKNLVHPIEADCYEYFFKNSQWSPDVYIYLCKNPEIAHKHIQTRCQDGDESISVEYLRELDKKYNELLEKVPFKNIYKVDANLSENEIHEEICKILLENELFVSDSYGKEM